MGELPSGAVSGVVVETVEVSKAVELSEATEDEAAEEESTEEEATEEGAAEDEATVGASVGGIQASETGQSPQFPSTVFPDESTFVEHHGVL